MKKEVYELRIKDFIPIVGLRKYADRCVYESWRHRSCREESEDYQVSCLARRCLLGMYNAAIIVGTILETSKLVNFLSKH